MTSNHKHMSGEEISDFIVRTRLEMLSGLKMFLLFTFIVAVAFSWYQSNIYLLIASPLMSFFEGIRRSKIWMQKTKQELNISEESIMQAWNWYKHTKRTNI